MSNYEQFESESVPPPAYSDDEQGDEELPPPYEDEQSATEDSASRFPEVMNAYASWARFRTFHLCGASKDDRICLAEVQGRGTKGPLGGRSGVVLYAGLSSDDGVLAAVGDENRWMRGWDSRYSDTMVLLPPLDPIPEATGLLTEKLRPFTAPGSEGGEVGFRFTIEAGPRARRQRFEWRRAEVGQGEGLNGKVGTRFVLVRRSTHHNGGPRGSARPQPQHGDGNGEVAGDGGESGTVPEPSMTQPVDEGPATLAVLDLPKLHTTFTHLFELRIVRPLGDRWSLMVVITALRLWQLRLLGALRKRST